MTYPATGEPVTEFLISGAWTDATARVRASSGVSITRGRQNEQGRVAAQTSVFTLNNRDGLFSNRNPSSSYYGLLPRNTQVRHLAGTGDTYLFIPYNDQPGFNEARTADKAALDITGDIEVRADIWPHTWRPGTIGTAGLAASTSAGGGTVIIASKYLQTTNNRSWAFYLLPSGKLALAWSPDGTLASRIIVKSTVAVPATSARLSVKVTLDVNNGAAGNDVKFYTASSIAGSYTQLGATVTTAGTTSVFSGSGDLCVGTGSDVAAIFTDGVTFGGRFYELRVYNGIGGTEVANPNFTSQSIGATSFSDGHSNTWTLSNKARIISDRQRFHGEVSAWPQAWDKSGTDVYAPVQASGMIRRLSQAGSPLRSPIYRQFIQYDDLFGYWPLEDGSTSDSGSSALSGGQAAQVSGVQFGQSSTLPGAASVAAFNAATSSLIATPATITATGTLTYVVYVKLSALPSTAKTLMVLYTSGTARRIEVGFDSSNWRFDFYGSDGTNLSSLAVTAATISPASAWIGFNLLLETSGGNVNWSARFLKVGSGGYSGVGPTSFAGSVGRFTGIRLIAGSETAYEDASFAHLMVASADIGFVSTPILNAANAHVGETAADRIDRLGTEEGIATEIIGFWDDSAAMGYQTTQTFMDLVYECVEADLGLLTESRSMLALVYRTRGDIEARRDIDLDYSAGHLTEAPMPTEDDQGLANDVTVTRTGGGSARATVDTGALSTQDAPDGVGRYPTSTTVNVSAESQLGDVAGWLSHLGTWDQSRYPQLAVGLHRSPFTASTTLAAEVMALDVGDTAALTDLPSWLPPDDVLLLVQGYTETLARFLWDITFNTTPAGPYRTGVYDNDSVPGYARYDTAGSTLHTTINSSATTVVVDCTNTADTWTTNSSMYPFDVVVGGEVITFGTAPSGSTSPQTFSNVTRSVNGVVKAHTSGVAVSLADPTFYAI